MSVRDLTDGQECELVLVLKHREDRVAATGSPWIKLALADRTGTVTGVVREACDRVPADCRGGTVVHVSGRVERHPRFGQELVVEAIRPALPEEGDLADLLDGPPATADAMERDLRDLVDTVQNPHLQRLLDALLGPGTPTWAAFRDAPAAKRFHQAYRHGLLEHSLTVAQGVSALAATFPGIDRDVAVTGALLHDIGKLDAYTSDPLSIELTDHGKLQGEIPLGYYRVRRLIESLPGFPERTAVAVLHVVLSHHGRLEHGSPVVPCTREATLVHMVDNLGASLGSFDRIEKALPDGQQWSGFDRALDGSAWFAGRVAA